MTVLLAACTGGGAGSTPSGSVTRASPPAPATLPAGLPPGYPLDVEPADLAFDQMVPDGADVTATAFPGEHTAIAIWAIGDDPLRREHGLAVWRRTPGEDPPWVATYAFRDPPRAGVLGIRVDTADATGDGEPDALVFENAGGSGTCGTWRLIALAVGGDEQTFVRDLCDASVEFSSRPVGLRLTESVFAPADPHCCPSGTTTTVLVWNGARWRVDSADAADT